MIKVIFKRSNGERVDLKVVNDTKEAFDVINEFLESHNFKSYYTRMWEEDGMIKLDVGSYTEFFYLEPMDISPQELRERILEGANEDE